MSIRCDFVPNRPSAILVVISIQGSIQEDTMGKTGRKRRARRKKAANHGKRPNS